MKLVKRGVIVWLLTLGCNGIAQTQLELNQSACAELKKADFHLNKVYQQVLSAHKKDHLFITHFKEAQRKWIAFRDAYEASMYIPEYYNSYGSVLPMCQCYFMEQLTKERIKQLSVWVNGIQEGDSCVGSTASGVTLIQTK